MDLTALYTFILDDAPFSSYIHLYGSWDNFTSAYPMTKDGKRSGRTWRGCHNFKNIVCDGDPRFVTAPRNGALKMGGQYWYYYKRDGDREFHNSKQPSTTTCPLLPGQTVNILDMPIDVSCSTAYTREFTVNPQARYAKLHPPTPSVEDLVGKYQYKSTEFKRERREDWLRMPWEGRQNAVVPKCKYFLRGRSASDNVVKYGEEFAPAEMDGTPLEPAFEKHEKLYSPVFASPFKTTVGDTLLSKVYTPLAEPTTSRPRTPKPLMQKEFAATNKLELQVSGNRAAELQAPPYTPSAPLHAHIRLRPGVNHTSSSSWASNDTFSTNLTQDFTSPVFSSAAQSVASPASSLYPSPLRKQDRTTIEYSSAALTYGFDAHHYQLASVAYGRPACQYENHAQSRQEAQRQLNHPAKDVSNQPVTVILPELDFDSDQMLEDLGYLGAFIH